MRLYSGSSKQFIEDTTENQIAEKLRLAFFDFFRYYPSPGELNSWRNSLRALKDIFVKGSLVDHGVILEYQLPVTSKRLDCLVCGKDSTAADNAVIIELKQWDKCTLGEEPNEVLTILGGAPREVLHPSAQVGQYKMYLADTHTAFYEGPDPIELSACSYLHNYSFLPNDPILDPRFSSLTNAYPLFSGDDTSTFSNYLLEKLAGGKGWEVLRRIESGKYRPSKKLMDHVAGIIRGNKAYVLLDEQKVVYDKVLTLARHGFHDKQKHAIIVRGGPGTGKSVIALNLMADLLQSNYNAHYVTGSKSFTETLWKIIGRRGAVQFRYTNNYVDAERDSVDVLICDEAHRIRVKTTNRFRPRADQSDQSQIEELIHAAKVSVFFIDDNQIVRPQEIGSTTYIKTYAEKTKCKTFEYELEAQFRCSGSDAFVNWVSNTLAVRRTANVLWEGKEEFDFRIVDTPFELENKIKERISEGNSARMTAGFCWKWSDPDEHGRLIEDVVIGTFRRPWNAKPKAQRRTNKSVRLADGVPEAPLWAYDPKGVGQIGCVYTAQGFEFDYVGVIVGRDLRYDFDSQQWVGHREEVHDSELKRSGDRFTSLVQNTYRVLLSRGMKGCYVYFMDEDTKRFFRSRMG